ncbi:IclR family transcriptional regulator [Phytohabitans suffuscus]|uniref:IclR family transcriptional regulator n=1 Tax=Phytohabitans suffuscus TaxID=624315 RepID=UPI0018D8EDF5|nr:helix-turn-helix domain-containing protein [Phytohabitans suffuscus]
MNESRLVNGDESPAQADIQAVRRVGQVLRLFGPDTGALTAAEVADRIGLNRTTAHRYCVSLVAAGLLDRGPQGGAFVPGAVLLQLGAFALRRQEVMRLAPPHMQRLASHTHLTAVLSLWGSSGPIVSRVEEDTTGDVLLTVRVGTQLTLETAQAQVFLAYRRDQLQVDRLLGNLAAADQTRIRGQIEAIRRSGVAVLRSASRGITAIAVPVFNEYGICATVALLGISALVSAEERSPQLLALRAAGDALTAELGGTPPPLDAGPPPVHHRL